MRDRGIEELRERGIEGEREGCREGGRGREGQGERGLVFRDYRIYSKRILTESNNYTKSANALSPSIKLFNPGLFSRDSPTHDFICEKLWDPLR